MTSQVKALQEITAAADFMSDVRPDIWPSISDAVDFISRFQELEEDGFLSTGGFTVFRNDNNEVRVTLDLLTLYLEDEDSFSWLTIPNIRDKFNI